MNSLTENLTATYKPTLAIVAYATDANMREAYLESHEINDRGELLEGKPLKQETIQSIVDFFYDERKNLSSFTGLFPDNILLFELQPGGSYKMIWWRPAENRNLYFSKNLHIKNGKASVPAMIYEVESGRLNVYTIQSSNRPDITTSLYRAPYYNVSENGSVCLGSAKVAKPEKTYAAVMKYWEDMFWLSEFTHLAGSSNPTKSNLAVIWQKLIGKELPFPAEELLPTKKTLKSLI